MSFFAFGTLLYIVGVIVFVTLADPATAAIAAQLMTGAGGALFGIGALVLAYEEAQKSESIPIDVNECEIVQPVQVNLSAYEAFLHDTDINATEQVLLARIASETGGILSRRIIRSITKEIPEARVDEIIGQLVEIGPSGYAYGERSSRAAQTKLTKFGCEALGVTITPPPARATAKIPKLTD